MKVMGVWQGEVWSGPVIGPVNPDRFRHGLREKYGRSSVPPVRVRQNSGIWPIWLGPDKLRHRALERGPCGKKTGRTARFSQKPA